MRRNRRNILLVAAAIGGFVAAPSLANAAFGDGATESTTVGSATVAPPTAVVATGDSAGVGNCRITLSWSATSSTFADGYEVFRAAVIDGIYTSIGSVSGRDTTTYADTGLPPAATYYYKVQATYLGWRSADSDAASATTPVVCA